MRTTKERLGNGFLFLLIAVFILNSACAKNKKPLKSMPSGDSSIDVARVWSGQHIDLYLATREKHQCVEYYDEVRRMTVAIRTLDSKVWDHYNIPDTPDLGWSSHKDIALEFDVGGYLHVSGNKHGTHIIYFKATKPYDVHSLKQVPMMVDRANELKGTSPQLKRI